MSETFFNPRVKSKRTTTEPCMRIEGICQRPGYEDYITLGLVGHFFCYMMGRGRTLNRPAEQGCYDFAEQGAKTTEKKKKRALSLWKQACKLCVWWVFIFYFFWERTDPWDRKFFHHIIPDTPFNILESRRGKKKSEMIFFSPKSQKI